MSSFKPISKNTKKITKKAIGNKNILLGNIISNWTNIVGKELSNITNPIKLSFRKNKDSQLITMHIGVKSSLSTEIQYKSQLIIDKINNYLGYQGIHELKIIHNNQEIQKNRVTYKVNNLDISDNTISKVQSITKDLKNSDLKEALKNLGNAIISRQIDK